MSNLTKEILNQLSWLDRHNPLRWFNKQFKSLSHNRLHNEIKPLEIEIEYLAESGKKGTWINKAGEAIAEVKTALDLCDIEKGWGLLNSARQMSVYGREGDGLRSYAQATLNESEEKLKDWRKKTVQNLLGKDGALKESVTNDDVYTALQILHEHQSNTHIKNNNFLSQLRTLAIAALVSLIIMWIVLPFAPLESEEVNISTQEDLTMIMVFGALGGSFSGIYSISKASRKEKIPDVILNSGLNLSRPVVGAISATAIMTFLASDILDVGPLSKGLIWAMSFASGLSERIIVGAVGELSS